MTRSRTRRIRVRWAATLAALGLVVVTLPAQQASADHSPIPGTVTLVGSLQQELGCPGDWQPDCGATRLTPVAGQPEAFRGTFDVPVGTTRTRSR